MTSIRYIILSVSVVLISFCSIRIYSFEQKRRAFKDDLIELSRIKYGLFSVDEWKIILSDIISRKIEELNFSPEQINSLRGKVESFLSKTFTELEARFHEEKSQTIGGVFQSVGVDVLGVFDKMKKDIPIFTEQILSFLSHPGNRDTLKNYIRDKLAEYTDKTFGEIDYNEQCRIIDQYSYGDRTDTIEGLKQDLDQLDKVGHWYVTTVYILTILTGLMLLLTTTIQKNEFVLYVLICLGLLAAGLFIPMIEIDARIEVLNFSLLGEQITFRDQVLYYRSKSILEVVRHMLEQDKWDVLFVGMLVLLFSVIFPLSKLICTAIYLYASKLRNNRFIQFMVFKTGKWSMADVMVVAIFMSYIGFSGILTEQLNQIEEMSSQLDILTTNKSSLQSGFFLFTSFAILSLLVAQRIQYPKTEIQ
ncbi:MAG TPA: paraquat-inducible protein A [Saprospiraceae bacterium]